MEINIGIIAIIVLAIAILAILASGYVKASPNKAYIISGIKREPKVLIGRAGIKIPFLEKKDELILKQISIDIKTNGYIPTKDFIGVDIDAVAKVRVLTQRDVTVNAKGEVVAGADANKRITTEMANAAMKNFLNMNEDQIRDALTDSLQGNMREIIGTQCLKELCNDRKTFGDEVQAKAQKDMNALGIWIESCNIQKIEDENNLITALGQDNMSQIQKDASVAKAQADRDVAIARAQAQKDAQQTQKVDQKAGPPAEVGQQARQQGGDDTAHLIHGRGIAHEPCLTFWRKIVGQQSCGEGHEDAHPNAHQRPHDQNQTDLVEQPRGAATHGVEQQPQEDQRAGGQMPAELGKNQVGDDDEQRRDTDDHLHQSLAAVGEIGLNDAQGRGDGGTGHDSQQGQGENADRQTPSGDGYL